MQISFWFEKLMRLRNPQFALSENITNYTLILFIVHLISCKIRGIFYSLVKGRVNMSLFLEGGVSLLYFRNMKLGKMLLVEKGTIVSALRPNSLCIGNNVKISAYSTIHVSKNFQDITGFIHIGDGVGIGEFANLGGAGGLEIGDNCIVGAYFSCHPENHNFEDKDCLIKYQGVSRKGIVIGSNCWIGAKVTILDGAKIGNSCVIAAGAVVKGEFPDHCVIGGIPAKILRKY
ncbi:acyltransferase [Parabacteroides faecis]|uniref:acyltransferase n=1 Tax=Parabacteroides TaxID=375288 RepID=UPI000F004D44|nr:MULTISPECIES: acyltransferase [Parabacteroides]MBC8619340.1 acyltransferase [Parabacteroides faecis]RHR92845.1 acyltransferase [Parabacteroides sp. AF14-59]